MIVKKKKDFARGSLKRGCQQKVKKKRKENHFLRFYLRRRKKRGEGGKKNVGKRRKRKQSQKEIFRFVRLHSLRASIYLIKKDIIHHFRPGHNFSNRKG